MFFVQCHHSLPKLRLTHHYTMCCSVLDASTTPHDPMFNVHVSHYLLGFPALDLLSRHQAVIDMYNKLLSPSSTPEPYVEQHNVALVAEMGNPVVVNVITDYYSCTGVYATSN